MVQIHIRIPDDKISMIESVMDGANTTEKLKNFICSNIIGKEALLYERDRCKAKLEYIERALKENPFHNIHSTSEEERQFLQETMDKITSKPEFKNSPPFFAARRKIYNEKFGKNIPFKEFELLIYKFKESLTLVPIG